LKDCQRDEMAYDEDLATRVRGQLADQEAATEKQMFGGIAFLLGGNMAVCIRGDELMVRVGREGADQALDEPHTRVLDMAGRPMRGWVLVTPAGLSAEPELRGWVERGVTFARSLPPKA
jgi:TfoX/Sxy family transcriptional regulator of competence genes